MAHRAPRRMRTDFQNRVPFFFFGGRQRIEKSENPRSAFACFPDSNRSFSPPTCWPAFPRFLVNLLLMFKVSKKHCAPSSPPVVDHGSLFSLLGAKGGLLPRNSFSHPPDDQFPPSVQETILRFCSSQKWQCMWWGRS